MDMTAFLLVCLTAVASADDRPAVIVVVGAPGTSEYGEQFARWSERWQAAGENGQADVVVIGGGDDESAVPADTDHNRLQRAIEQTSTMGRSAVWIVLIGHGTFDGHQAKFNLVGPDLDVAELAAMIAPIQRPVAVVDCTSASGPFLKGLSAKNRVIVTATRSGDEINYARFGEFLSAAIGDPSTDLDKDEQVSLLEAFLTASKRVEEFYKSDGRLATEHALIDDNGDGFGTPADWFRGVRATKRAKDGAELDGARARQIHLVPSDQENKLSPEAQARRDDLELALEELRGQREKLGEDEYYARLQLILVELSRLYVDETNSGGASETEPQPLGSDGAIPNAP